MQGVLQNWKTVSDSLGCPLFLVRLVISLPVHVRFLIMEQNQKSTGLWYLKQRKFICDCVKKLVLTQWIKKVLKASDFFFSLYLAFCF